MKSLRLALAALVLAQPLSAAQAADWQLVLSDRSRRVEIDRGSIFVSDGGTKVSWGRVVLSPAAASRTGHAMIKALNRYDCVNRTIVTIKRVYLDGDAHVLREESVRDQTPLVVTRNSVDERMWREVCRPSTSAAELQNVADQLAALTTGRSATAAPPAVSDPPVTPAAAQAITASTAPEAGSQASILPPLPNLRAAAGAPPALAPAPPAAAPVSAAVPVPVSAAPAPTASAARRLAPRPAAASVPDWSYAAGPNGPQNWGRLHPEWKLCSSGTRQSPIDLRDGVAVELAPVRFDYRPTAFRVRDTGRTVQVDVVEGMGIEVRGTRYALERFTLHRPSMERIEGRAEDMAVYLEHRSATGEVAILSVLLAVGDEANPALQAVWNNLPLDRGLDFLPAASIDLAAFVPAASGHYLYQGSLPTPPCSEGVLWVVMKQPLSISPEQLAVFARLYPRSGRPIQPSNGRLILESR